MAAEQRFLAAGGGADFGRLVAGGFFHFAHFQLDLGRGARAQQRRAGRVGPAAAELPTARLGDHERAEA